VGSGNFGAELDEHLEGATVGADLAFTVDLTTPKAPAADPEGAVDEGAADAPPAPPRRELSYEVHVKEVKEMVLPDVTDEWASEASEFETVAELMADIERRLTVVKRAQSQAALRSQAIEAVAELVLDDPPEPLVNEEITHRAHELENALRQQGLNIGQYLTATGRSQQQLIDELRAQSTQAVKADLALRAVAELENIEITEADVDAEILRLADRFDAKPADVREQLESNEQMAAVRSDVKRGMAVEWLVEHIEAVDPLGQPIDSALLVEPPQVDTDDGDTASEAADAADET